MGRPGQEESREDDDGQGAFSVTVGGRVRRASQRSGSKRGLRLGGDPGDSRARCARSDKVSGMTFDARRAACFRQLAWWTLSLSVSRCVRGCLLDVSVAVVFNRSGHTLFARSSSLGRWPLTLSGDLFDARS